MTVNQFKLLVRPSIFQQPRFFASHGSIRTKVVLKNESFRPQVLHLKILVSFFWMWLQVTWTSGPYANFWSRVVSPVSRFAREPFRPWVVSPVGLSPWVVSPWVVSPWVVSPVGRFAPIWWVVSPLFFIKSPRLEPGHVWRYLRWSGLSHDNF